MKYIITFALFIFLLTACSKDVREMNISEMQNPEVKEKIKKELTTEEQNLLVAGSIRYAFKHGLTGNKIKEAKITIGEIIENQKKFELDLQKKRQEEEMKNPQYQ